MRDTVASERIRPGQQFHLPGPIYSYEYSDVYSYFFFFAFFFDVFFAFFAIASSFGLR